FQAEDGIRDDLVTGVQTCALPICENICSIRLSRVACALPAIIPAAAMAPALIIGLRGRPVPDSRLTALKASPVGSTPILASTSRSEERRVGKEGRSRRA